MQKLFLLITFLFASPLVFASWGATPLTDKDRPQRGWINAFSKAAVRVADERRNIQDAISACPQTGYCTVRVKKRLTPYPDFYLSRSKTKIIGVNDANNAAPEIRTNEAADESASYIWIDNDNKAGMLEEVVIENLSLLGRKINGKEKSLKGIVVQGSNINKIQIVGNTIDGIQVIGSTANNEDVAFTAAILILGTGQKETDAIRDMIIEDNTVTRMRTGNSESISISGNVKNWEIKNNTIIDVDNIAIDVGGEGHFPLDAARYGFVEGNTVKKFAFPEKYRAAAIYVDGGRYIHIEGNLTDGTRVGYTIGAENCLVASHITMINNTSKNSEREDLMIGGWGKDACDGSDDGIGSVSHITVKGNNFSATALSYRISNAIIKEAGVKPINIQNHGAVPSQKLPNGNAIKVN